MDVGYQMLNFDVGRARAVVDRLDARAPHLAPRLSTLTIGDFSCHYRNEHTTKNRWDSDEHVAFRAWRKERGLELLYQLPLIVKEIEFRAAMIVVDRLWDDVDGFITADLGVLRELQQRMDARGDTKDLIFTSNVLNRRYAEVLGNRFRLRALRPLFHKRTFLDHDVGFDKDVVVYGNMMINCSVFCFHCGDLPTKCDYSCEEPKELIMEHEHMKMVGRSLLTTNRLDLVDRLPQISRVRTATIMDLDLDPDEVVDVIQRISDAVTAAA